MAHLRHKRDTDARAKPRALVVAGPLAFLVTALAVTAGVVATDPAASDLVAAENTTASRDGAYLAGVMRRQDQVISRSAVRSQTRIEAMRAANRARKARLAKARAAERAATARAIRQADTRLWTTALLNLWTDATSDATRVGLLSAGKHVLVTGREAHGRQELVIGGKSRWVTAGYLSDDKPTPTGSTGSSGDAAPAGLSMAPCPDSSVENGLTYNAVRVYRAVCHAFPQITSYGGWDAHGEHASGRALDVMTSDKALGDQIAAFLQSHASELHLYDIIWWDQIWTPERAAEGWRYYGDHGSATANHMDHVHVSTY